MFLIAKHDGPDPHDVPGFRVLTAGPVTVLGERGRDILVLAGVLYPDTRLRPDDVLRMFRDERPLEQWRTVKGCYAGAYVDARTGGVTVFNDHAGIHDVYAWLDRPGGPSAPVANFAVSDDFATLARHVPAAARRLDGDASVQYVALGTTINGRTFAEGIRRLAPGTRLTVLNGEITRQAVWRYEMRPAGWTMDEAVTHCWDLLGRAAQRMRALTGPRSRGLLGLSGGRDSRITARVCLDAGIDVRPYFFGEQNSDAATIVNQIAQALDLKVEFPGHNRGLARYFDRSLRHQPLADLEWCKYLTGRDELVADADAMLSGHLGDHVFGIRSFRAATGPEDDRGVARELLQNYLLEKTDPDTAERIVDEITAQVAEIGGSVIQRKQGFHFHTMNMTAKQCGLFQTLERLPHYSPFEDIDVLEAALTLPDAWRLRNRFYQRMFTQCLPELGVDRISAAGSGNEHKPIHEWLRGNADFAEGVAALVDPGEDLGLYRQERTFGDATAQILAGQATKNDIHQYFRRLTIQAYRRYYE
jgi:asparagine synthetase B (glutamine-hydrolysing)